MSEILYYQKCLTVFSSSSTFSTRYASTIQNCWQFFSVNRNYNIPFLQPEMNIIPNVWQRFSLCNKLPPHLVSLRISSRFGVSELLATEQEADISPPQLDLYCFSLSLFTFHFSMFNFHFSLRTPETGSRSRYIASPTWPILPFTFHFTFRFYFHFSLSLFTFYFSI